MPKHRYKIKPVKKLSKVKSRVQRSQRIKMSRTDKFGPPAMNRADVEIERMSKSNE